jgi:hypothetical protein
MVILKATSFLEGHKSDIRWTSSIIRQEFDQNLIVINHKPNSNFKSHLIFGGTQEWHKKNF